MAAELSLEPGARCGHGAAHKALNGAGTGRPPELGAGRAAAADLGRRADPVGGGCEQLTAAGYGCQPGAAVLSLLRVGQRQCAADPGWLYSFVAAMEPRRTSWTLLLDAIRIGPPDDATVVTATQVREVVIQIIEAGHWRDGDPDILVVFDSGYDLTRLAWLLADLPVEVLGRLRSAWVMDLPAPARILRERPPGPARRCGQAHR